jgi:hypothetical protein
MKADNKINDLHFDFKRMLVKTFIQNKYNNRFLSETQLIFK